MLISINLNLDVLHSYTVIEYKLTCSIFGVCTAKPAFLLDTSLISDAKLKLASTSSYSHYKLLPVPKVTSYIS